MQRRRLSAYAVPVLMAKAIGREILKSLRDAEAQRTANRRNAA